MVSREEGMEEIKKDILGCYKNPNCQLKAQCFEGEEGAGSGPVREFLLCAMKVPEEGIGKEGKPVISVEGEDDYKVSTAVKQYWATMGSDKIEDNDLATQPLPLILEDIPDLVRDILTLNLDITYLR